MSDAAAEHNRIHRAIDAVRRIESAKVIAAAARMVGDVGVAVDLAQTRTTPNGELIRLLDQDRARWREERQRIDRSGTRGGTLPDHEISHQPVNASLSVGFCGASCGTWITARLMIERTS